MANKTLNIQDLAQATAFDVDGEKLGSVEDVYINDATGQPDFVDVNHGLFNARNSIVPLRGHTLENGELRLAFGKDRIKDAPNLDVENHITEEQREEFFRHYGVEAVQDQAQYKEPAPRSPQPTPSAGRHAATGGAAAGAAAGTPATDSAAEMVRSEERLNVDKNVETTGNVTLRKYVVHDTETVEVPVEREEVRVERQPLTGEEADKLRGQDLSDDEASVTLHEERVTVNKESVPVEKVSLEKDTIRDTQTVTEDVAKERIEASDDLKK